MEELMSDEMKRLLDELNILAKEMNKEKVWNEVALSCWEGCNVESESNVKGPGLSSSVFRVFGFVDDTGFRTSAPGRDTRRRLGYPYDSECCT